MKPLYSTPANRAWFPHPPQKARIFVGGHDIENWPEGVPFPNLGGEPSERVKQLVKELPEIKVKFRFRDT